MEKLVRDRIPEIISSDGRECCCRIASPEEYHTLLLSKLDEEVAEFKEDENLEELADVLEVLLALTKDLGYSVDDLKEYNSRKRKERGSFEKRLVLKL